MVAVDLKPEITYPSSNGEPLAESYAHLYAILTTLEVLKQYLANRQATVMANQFLYYSQGFPKLRVAPDVMIIFDLVLEEKDNYKIWEAGQVPKVIFEMTSQGTKNQDQEFKKTLYEQLGVLEYWLFDPKGEWITEKLQGYRLRNEQYERIANNYSEPLQLQLRIDGNLIGFYREDTGEKLLIPEELAQALQQQKVELEQKEIELEQERQKNAEMELLLQKYREQFGELE